MLFTVLPREMRVLAVLGLLGALVFLGAVLLF